MLRAKPDLDAKIKPAPRSTLWNENIRLVVSVRHKRLNLSSWRRWC